MKHIFILAALTVALTGCASKPETKFIPVIETVTTILSPPVEYFKPIERVKPPAISLYVVADWDQKEKILFDHISLLNGQIENLAVDRSSISLWLKAQEKLQLEKANK